MNSILVRIMDKVKYYWSKTNRWHRLTTVFLIAELKLIPGGHLGFSCGDPALSHPFTGDTVSWKWLMAITIFLPVAFLLIVERTYHSGNKQRPKARALLWYKEYLYGLLINLTIVEGLKVVVGAPRPHFFDTCRPVEAGSCQGSEYIASYTCTKAHWIAQSDRSFPSGHTSMAVHAGVFIAYYLYRRVVPSQRTKRTLSTLQASCLLGALFCSLSRLYDHRHHWWDVATGAAIAGIVLVYTIFVLCKNFESPKVQKTQVSIEKREANGVRTEELLETSPTTSADLCSKAL